MFEAWTKEPKVAKGVGDFKSGFAITVVGRLCGVIPMFMGSNLKARKTTWESKMPQAKT